MDIRFNAVRGYADLKPATEPVAGEAGIAGAVKDFAATLAEGEQAAMDSMTSQADPHTLVEALAQTQLAVETAVAVRNKVVEAYQEILRMPI